MAQKAFSIHSFGRCKRYGMPLWQCPDFLFVVMGIVIIIASIAFYAIGERYISDPRIVALIVMIVTMILLIIAFIITRSFEMLAETNKMKTEFVNIVSHQLRAPLTNLRWATQFLTSQEFKASKDEEREEYFDIIKENSVRMENLIDDLLTVTRLREGKMDRKKTTFSLEALTKEILSEYSSFADASHLKITLEAEKSLPDVYSSYPLTKIVVENLVANAINYSQGGKEIKISLKKKGKNVLFQIQDQGIGIPAEDKKYIFQKFFRSKNAVRAEVYGTGLGLFIVKMILDGMNGKVWFKSKEGEGSTFYFTLPAA